MNPLQLNKNFVLSEFRANLLRLEKDSGTLKYVSMYLFSSWALLSTLRLQLFQNRYDKIVGVEIEAPSLHAILGVYVFLHLCYSKGKFDDILSIPSFPWL